MKEENKKIKKILFTKIPKERHLIIVFKNERKKLQYLYVYYI